MRRALLLMALLLGFTPLCADTYVVCIGIANYASPRISNLTVSEKDAKAMAALFKKGSANVITITGRHATKAAMLRAIAGQCSRARTGDRLIIYYSGHGFPGGFCPYDMTSISDGLTYAEVLKLMKASRASTKMIFADACSSGSIRAPEASSRPRAGDIMMFLSSRGNESSLENPFLANGYFTKYLLRGLGGAADSDADRKVTASELFDYVSKSVTRRTDDRQHPVMWGRFPDDMAVVEYGVK